MKNQEQVNVKGAAKNAAIREKDERPTHDQLYLATRINERTEGQSLTIPAIQRLNTRYGVAPVSSAMRLLRGFPAGDAVRSPYPYLVAMLKEEK